MFLRLLKHFIQNNVKTILQIVRIRWFDNRCDILITEDSSKFSVNFNVILYVFRFFETESQTLNSDSSVYGLEIGTGTEHNLLSDIGTDCGSEIGEAGSDNQLLLQRTFKKLSLREKLVKWTTYNLKFLPHTVIDELLQLLRPEGHNDLPQTVKLC